MKSAASQVASPARMYLPVAEIAVSFMRLVLSSQFGSPAGNATSRPWACAGR
jgi:hypothetical protein